MRLLDRYVCREVASHAALGLAVFTFVFFVPQLVKLMDLVVRHSSGFGTVLLLFLCSIPPVLGFTLPMAVLVGVLIGLGRLSADSEIVALHASGISLRRLLVPIGFVAFASAVVTLVMTFWLSPLSIRTLRGLEYQLLASQAPFGVQPRVFDERFPRLVLYVQDVQAAATRWTGVFLADSSLNGGPSNVTLAENALVIANRETRQLELHLGSGSTHEYDPRDPEKYNVTTFGESDIPVDLSGSLQVPKNPIVSGAEQSVSQLIAAKGPAWRDARVEFHRRIAFPAACLVFALLGVPIGVRPRRGGRAAGLILTLVLIGTYYFVFVTGAHAAQQGSISPGLGIWAANIVAAILGVVFLQRIERIRKPNRIVAWIESWRLSRLPQQRRESDAAALPESNGSVTKGDATSAPVSSGTISNIPASLAFSRPRARMRRAIQAGSIAFPMLVDVYMLQQFLYYFVVVLVGFVLIFDAFTLFDLLGDISKNHIAASMVLDYFRFLVPLMVYQLAPLATLVATLVTLGVLAKNNEVIAFKARA
jgi:LPS export ABC transporter permease LptF